MAAPMRHFTEYAGLRPSILAMTLACAPSVTRLRRTSGVRPMLNELSGKIMFCSRSDVPVCHVAGLGFLPGARELGKGGVVEDVCDGRIHLLPDLVKRVRSHALGLLVVFNEAENFAHRDFIGRLGQTITAFGAAAGFDKASLLESGEDQLEKLLRDFLAACHISDLDGLARRLQREVEDRQQGVFTFYGNVHADRANGTFYLAIVGVGGAVCKGVTWNTRAVRGPVVLRNHKILRKYISFRFHKLMRRHLAGGRLPAATLLVA